MSAVIRICLALLVTASGAAAQEDRDDYGGPPTLDSLSPVVLQLESGAPFRPKVIVVDTPDGFVSLEIPNLVEQRSEDRIGLGNVPIIGGVFQARAIDEFQDALFIGGARRDGNKIIVSGRADGGAPVTLNGVRTVVIANRDRSFRFRWDNSQAPVPVLGDLPAIGELFLLGPAYRNADSLVIIATPSIVRLLE